MNRSAAKHLSAAPLPTHPLGRTDMHITRAGFGAWAIGGPAGKVGWGTQDDSASIAAIRHAVERGINWIDTAAAYGKGHSEDVVRAALSTIPRSERPYIFTKCGQVWDGANPAAPSRIGTPSSIRRELENSLYRLGVDRIDLYQMHWPPADGTPLEVYWQTLLDLKAEGKVRAVGLSNHSAAQLEAAERLGHVDSLQPQFSAIHRDVAAAELPWCREHETGVIVYSPMASGLLTGSFTTGRARTLPQNDWRSGSQDFTGDGLRRNLALADALTPIAARHDTNIASIAVAWTLGWPGVTAAIVGARSPAQIDGWLDAATLQLTPEDMNDIATAISATGAGSGPTRPQR